MNTTKIQNPYWNEIQDKDVEHSLRLVNIDVWQSRFDYCGKYSWSIPDPISVTFVAQHLGSKAVEMGAGNGYYASLLAQSGVDIICYDALPPDKVTNNHYHSPRKGRCEDFTGETVHTYHSVEQGTPEALQHHSDRTLFLCWPPYDDDMATQCIKNYTGNRIVYIGESNGGCTGDGAFFELLEKEWQQVAMHKPVQWEGIHDYIEVYERIQ